MDRESNLQSPKPAERAEIEQEKRDAETGDASLDEYDKAVADSFPASDPPAGP